MNLLECEILAKIPVPMLNSPLALRGKEDDIVREKKYKLSMLSDLVKNKLKHAHSKTKLQSQSIKNTAKYLQFWLTFFCLFCFFLSF